MTANDSASGLYTAGERSVFLYSPRTPRNNTALGIMGLHGHNGGSDQFLQNASALGAHMKALADAGALILAGDVGGVATFGTDACMTAITALYNGLIATGMAKGPKVGIVAWSMGGHNALNWVKRNPTKVAGVQLWTPLTDLDFFHATAGYTPAYSPGSVAAGAFAAEIDTAYGGSANYAANSVGHRVRDEYASWAGLGIPIKVFTAVDDNVIPVGQSRDGFVAGVNDPNVTFRSVPSGSHTGLFDQVPVSETIDFWRQVSF